MALYLASYPDHLMRNDPVKSCTEYFQDFQQYLADAIGNAGIPKADHLIRLISTTILLLSLQKWSMPSAAALYSYEGYHEMVILSIIFSREAAEGNFIGYPSLSQQLQGEYDALSSS